MIVARQSKQRSWFVLWWILLNLRTSNHPFSKHTGRSTETDFPLKRLRKPAKSLQKASGKNHKEKLVGKTSVQWSQTNQPRFGRKENPWNTFFSPFWLKSFEQQPQWGARRARRRGEAPCLAMRGMDLTSVSWATRTIAACLTMCEMGSCLLCFLVCVCLLGAGLKGKDPSLLGR